MDWVLMSADTVIFYDEKGNPTDEESLDDLVKFYIDENNIKSTSYRIDGDNIYILNGKTTVKVTDIKEVAQFFIDKELDPVEDRESEDEKSQPIVKSQPENNRITAEEFLKIKGKWNGKIYGKNIVYKNGKKYFIEDPIMLKTVFSQLNGKLASLDVSVAQLTAFVAKNKSKMTPEEVQYLLKSIQSEIKSLSKIANNIVQDKGIER